MYLEMDIKKLSFNIVLNILIFAFIASFFVSLELPVDFGYYVALLLIVGLCVELYLPLLRFLTLPINIITLVIVVTSILTGLFYLFELFMPGFYVNGVSFDSQTFNIITVEGFVLGKFASMILISLFIALLKAFVEWMRTPN